MSTSRQKAGPWIALIVLLSNNKTGEEPLPFMVIKFSAAEAVILIESQVIKCGTNTDYSTNRAYLCFFFF